MKIISEFLLFVFFINCGDEFFRIIQRCPITNRIYKRVGPHQIFGGSQSNLIGSKWVIHLKFWIFCFAHKMRKKILCDAKFNPREVRLNIKKLENLRKLES